MSGRVGSNTGQVTSTRISLVFAGPTRQHIPVPQSFSRTSPHVHYQNASVARNTIPFPLSTPLLGKPLIYQIVNPGHNRPIRAAIAPSRSSTRHNDITFRADMQRATTPQFMTRTYENVAAPAAEVQRAWSCATRLSGTAHDPTVATT